MRKILMLTGVVLILAACLLAQDAGQSSGMKTIKGCLQYSKHHYVLTDSSGAQHQLSGYANKLKPHVGHEVEITGTPGVHTEAPTSDAGSSPRQIDDIKVSSIKHIADTCTAGQ